MIKKVSTLTKFLKAPNKIGLIKTMLKISPMIILDLLRGDEVNIHFEWDDKGKHE